MARPAQRFVDSFAAEPVRVSAILRLPLIGLIAVLVWIWEVDHWLPQLYAVILGAYAVAAVLWLLALMRGPVPRWGDWASTSVDLMVILTLCLVSGGATAALLPVFFLLPISAAFQDRPWMTAIIGTVTAAGYLAVWIFYSERDDKVGLPNMVYTHFGFLLWLAFAVTALCYVLARRSARVRALQEMRRQLVSEAMHPTNGTTERSPSIFMTARCRRCWRRGSSWTRRVNAIPIPRSTWCTRRCRKPPQDCGRPSRSCTRRCLRSWTSLRRCENWYGSSSLATT